MCSELGMWAMWCHAEWRRAPTNKQTPPGIGQSGKGQQMTAILAIQVVSIAAAQRVKDCFLLIASWVVLSDIIIIQHNIREISFVVRNWNSFWNMALPMEEFPAAGSNLKRKSDIKQFKWLVLPNWEINV